MSTKKHEHRMPSCNAADIEKITDAVETLRGNNYDDAMDLMDRITPRGLCMLLHAMRRWYSYQSWNAAKKILRYRRQLMNLKVMELDPEDVVGAYRGFKVPRNSDLADVEVGDLIKLPVERNGGCTSWTLRQSKANLFSGKSKDKIGLVVRLDSPRGVRPFIAPPSRTASWFDSLYAKTMGRSFRFKEQEYAVCGGRVSVEVVRVKR